MELAFLLAAAGPASTTQVVPGLALEEVRKNKFSKICVGARIESPPTCLANRHTVNR